MSGQILAKQADEKFCGSCGAIIKIAAAICPKCGTRNVQPQSQSNALSSEKSRLTALLLCIFFSILGIHQFYVGNTRNGIIQLCTFGGCGIWVTIDFFLILFGKFTDANGLPLEKW